MHGVKHVFGRWLVEGAPFVLLFDLNNSFCRLDEWKRDLWDVAGVPAPRDDHETNQAVVFGYLVTWFLDQFLTAQNTFQSRTLKDIELLDPNISKPVVIVHFHEWLSGVALLLIRKRNLELVFLAYNRQLYSQLMQHYSVDIYVQAMLISITILNSST
jgi:glycogen(starch) synthase